MNFQKEKALLEEKVDALQVEFKNKLIEFQTEVSEVFKKADEGIERVQHVEDWNKKAEKSLELAMTILDKYSYMTNGDIKKNEVDSEIK